MKKIIAAAAALLISGFAFAQDLTVEAGPRIGDELNIFDFKNGDFDDFVDSLAVHPEYGDEDNTKCFYFSLDIPVLVTYKINVNEHFFIRPEVGPRFSFVLGKLYDKDWDKYDNDLKSPFGFGLTAGVCFGINVGPGAIVIDARYNRNFTKFVYDDTDFEIGSPQSIELSVGYAFKIM